MIWRRIHSLNLTNSGESRYLEITSILERNTAICWEVLTNRINLLLSIRICPNNNTSLHTKCHHRISPSAKRLSCWGSSWWSASVSNEEDTWKMKRYWNWPSFSPKSRPSSRLNLAILWLTLCYYHCLFTCLPRTSASNSWGIQSKRGGIERLTKTTKMSKMIVWWGR